MTWSSREFLIAWNQIPGVGGRRLSQIAKHFGSLDEAWLGSEGDFRQVPGIGPKLASTIKERQPHICPDRELEWAARHKAGIVTIADEAYPQALRELAVPPIVLYFRGRLPGRNQTRIAIVGSRNPTVTGKKQAFHFAATLAREGIEIVSGLARGIDKQAHLGAVRQQAYNIGILGSNFGQLYPQEHTNLIERIAEVGCVITEFSSNERIHPGNFPRRNRLISGLSQAVLVVEAGKSSGALNTVQWALEQGKDVLTIPGDISSPLRQGNHGLIKEGAYLVDSPQDIYAILNWTSVLTANIQKENKEDEVISLWTKGCSAEEILKITGLTVPVVQQKIALAQVQGVIRNRFSK